MKQYVVYAFTDKVFAGNPAAVCVMDKWLDDELMMKITIENNLSAAACCTQGSRATALSSQVRPRCSARRKFILTSELSN